jgi:hypothetical protein
MQKLFSKILVPVNFNRNTHWLLDKAVQLANKFDCDLVLIHVQGPSLLSNGKEKEMEELQVHYKAKLNEGLLLTFSIKAGYWQAVVKDVVISEHIDLVVIPRSHRHISGALIRRINVNTLSQQTNCPVMTITRNFNAQQLQNIVVPVFDLLPVKKLTIATYLSLEASGCIYLMGKDESTSAGSGNRYLMKAYQLLNEFGKVNIRCSFQDSEETADSTLAYAKNVNANLIVVNPGRESRLRGWWNKLRGKYLCRESDIPVLTVAN